MGGARDPPLDHFITCFEMFLLILITVLYFYQVFDGFADVEQSPGVDFSRIPMVFSNLERIFQLESRHCKGLLGDFIPLSTEILYFPIA